jgi:flagellar hook-length control protein FliK
MSSINSAAPAAAVTAPTLGSPSQTGTCASGADPAGFSQAMNAAAMPAAPASASPGATTGASTGTTTDGTSGHRSRNAAGGSSVPPHGKQSPPSTVVTLPAALVPAAAPGNAAVAQLPPAAADTAVAAKPAAAPAAAGIDAVNGPARSGTVMPAEHGRDAAPAARTASADAAATSEASQLATTTAAAGPAAEPTTGAAAAAADDAAAAAALDRFPELPGEAPAVTGKAASPPPANAPANAAAPVGDADLQGAAAIATGARVLPVFSLQAAGGRQGDTAAAGPAVPAADTSAGAVASAAGLNASAAAQGAAAPAAAAPPAPQPASPQFPEQLAAHVSYLVDSNLNGATLQVSPPQLGPIELRVSVDAGHAQVWLSAHSAATVDALQQSSPKLRDMLASQGFGQVSVDVSQRSFQDRSQGAQPYVWGGSDEPRAQPGAAPLPASVQRTASGVLDAYA